MANINFCAFGGLDERGKNLYAVEVNKEIYLFDGGTKNPERGILGIDVIIPNYDYLKENINRIKGVFITKPSDECFEGLTYILKDLNIPVYCSELAAAILKFHLQRFKARNKEKLFIIIKDKDIIDFNSCQIEVFTTTTSMPNSFGYVLHTEDGKIVYAGDYMFDAKAEKNFNTNLAHLSVIADKKPVLLFLSESSSSSRLDYTAPNHRIKNYVERAIRSASGRILFSCYDQDLHKISELLQIIADVNETINVGIYGQTLVESFKVLVKDNETIFSKVNVLPLNQVVKQEKGIIIITGSGERLYNRLIKIASGNDDLLDVLETDTIILATPPNPGSELNHANVLDELARTVATIIPLSSKKVWTMNASYEDIKLMTSILNPKYFIPVKGLYKDFVKAREAALDAGISAENIILADNGDQITFIDGVVQNKVNEIKVGNVYVDGIGVGDIGAVVLNERKQLATEGVIIVGASISSETKELASLIDMQMRGVIYIQENNTIFKKIQKNIADILEKYCLKFKENNTYDVNEVKNEIKVDLASKIKSETGKTPIILVIINEI